jgi:NAD(P)-dependent dehydrogenase (short-subunit alcohol dehydrogenase family)
VNEIPTALVTGASRGIGRAIAVQLARDGYRVAVNYCHRRDAADETLAEIDAAGGQAFVVQADVSHSEDRGRMLAEVLTASGGRLDVLVNNAGITSPGRRDLLEATEESWDEVLGTNLKGPFFLAQQAAKVMLAGIAENKQTRGTIVNISSISAYAVSTDRADYCIAKSAAGMMTALFATRLADHNIRVFEISPGVIASDMTAPVQAKYDRLIAEGLSPIRRWGTPEDVAKAVAIVVSEDLPFTTGQRIDVDGGFHLRRL